MHLYILGPQGGRLRVVDLRRIALSMCGPVIAFFKPVARADDLLLCG